MRKIDESVILRYLQGKSTNEDFKLMNEWMDISPNNKRFLFTIEELLAKSKHKEDESEIVGAALERLKSRLASEESETQSPNDFMSENHKPVVRMFFPFMKYAAAVVFVVFLGILSYLWLDTDKKINVYADNKIKKIELPDGTKVWLNKGSLLSYSENFGPDGRKVFLNGEAYFEVSKQPNKQKFTVESKMMNVVVKGTIFNMNSYSNGSKAETSLIEGEVLVETPDKESRIVLLPGQKAVFDIDKNRLTVNETNSNMDGVWRNDMLPFQNASIKDIAEVLKNLYKVDIHLSPDLDLSNTYSGMIKKKDKLDDVMNALKNSIPIEYEIKNNSVIIKSR